MKRNEVILIEDDDETPSKKKKKVSIYNEIDKTVFLRDENINGTLIELSFNYLIKNRPHQLIKNDLNEHVVALYSTENKNHAYTINKIFEFSSINWKQKGFIFIPWNLKNKDHWTLVAIDIVKEQVLFFDSLGSLDNFLQVSVYIHNWLNLSMVEAPKRIKEGEMINCCKGRRHQREGFSCGAYVIFYAELLSRGVPFEKIVQHPSCNDDVILFYRKELFLRLEYISSKQDNNN